MQQQQFTPLFQDWDRSFSLWYEQFQTYPHKDQLQDYEHQWKQWQEQMNATNAHLQERVATLTAMVPFAAGQYNSGMIGQYGQFPGQDMQMQQQSLSLGIQHSPVAAGPRSQGPRPTGFGPQQETPAGPAVRGGGPAGMGVRPPGPPTIQPPSFNSVRGPRSVGVVSYYCVVVTSNFKKYITTYLGYGCHLKKISSLNKLELTPNSICIPHCPCHSTPPSIICILAYQSCHLIDACCLTSDDFLRAS